MPKVKNPLLSMEARGGIGGLVFNTWRGINYVKTNTSPTGQGTAKRLAAQALLIQVAQQWKTITDVQRTAWGVYAADHPVTDWTGAPKRLTGQNWYMKCNVQLARQGNALIDDPPAVAAPDAATGIALSQDVNDLFIDWTTPVAANMTLICHLVGPHSVGVTGKIEMAQFEKALSANSAAPIVLKATPGTGRYTVFVKVMSSVTGLCSSWVSDFFDLVTV